MDSQSQNTSLQRLQNVEKRIVRVLELAGGVMDEMANPSGPRKELIDSHCSEFMQLIKINVLEELKNDASEQDEDEIKPIESDEEPTSQADGFDEKPDINDVPMEEIQASQKRPPERQDLNERTLDLSLG